MRAHHGLRPVTVKCAAPMFGDGLLFGALSWDEIEAIYHLLPEPMPMPRRNLCERGLLKIERLDPGELYMFRFHKVDYGKLLASLMILEEFITFPSE